MGEARTVACNSFEARLDKAQVNSSRESSMKTHVDGHSRPPHMMEEQMTNSTTVIKDLAPRRSFFGHLGGAMVLGLAGFLPKSLHAQASARPDGPNWPGMLRGRHRQVVDAYEANSGFPLAFAYTFLLPN